MNFDFIFILRYLWKRKCGKLIKCQILLKKEGDGDNSDEHCVLQRIFIYARYALLFSILALSFSVLLGLFNQTEAF